MTDFNLLPVPAVTLNNLTAPSILDGVKLAWDALFDINLFTVEIWRSDDNDRSNATLKGNALGSEFLDESAIAGNTYFYWIRAKTFDGRTDGAWEPVSATGGVQSDTLFVTFGVIADSAVQTTTLAANAATDMTVVTENAIVLTDTFDTEWNKLMKIDFTVPATFEVLLTYNSNMSYDPSGFVVDATGRNIQLIFHIELLDLDDLELIDAQDETNYDGIGDNGTFDGGSGYAALDSIFVACGTTVTVDTVSSGVITEFSISSPKTVNTFRPLIRSQSSTTGSGVGFTITPQENNVLDLAGGQIFDTLTQPFFIKNDATFGVWIDYQATSLLFVETLITGRNFRFQGMYLQTTNNPSNQVTHFITNQIMTKLVLKR